MRKEGGDLALREGHNLAKDIFKMNLDAMPSIVSCSKIGQKIGSFGGAKKIMLSDLPS